MTSVYVAIVVAGLLMFVTVIVDGADKMSAGREATTAAREAGRAASQELDAAVVGGGDPNLDTPKAAAAARRYLRETGMSGDVSTNGSTVTVTTYVPWSSTFALVPSQTMTGTATVAPQSVAP